MKTTIEKYQIAEIERQNYIRLKNRIIFFDSMIDIDSIPDFLQKYYLICDLTEDYKSPVTLWVYGYGGDAYGTLGLIDIINTLKTPINTFSSGAAQSASAILALSGTGKRFATKNSAFMIHQVSSGGIFSTSEQEVNLKENIRIEKLLINILSKKSNKPMKFWTSMISSNKDIYLSVNDCLKYKLLDGVLNQKDL